MNPVYAESVLRRDFGAGCLVTLHHVEPGLAGGRGVLAGPFRVAGNDLRFGGLRVTLARAVDLGQATRSGRVRYAGIWTPGRVYVTGLRVRRAFDVDAGTTVRLARNGLEWGFAS